jgi:hypothetical protein
VLKTAQKNHKPNHPFAKQAIDYTVTPTSIQHKKRTEKFFLEIPVDYTLNVILRTSQTV